jgi:hypothetical protein
MCHTYFSWEPFPQRASKRDIVIDSQSARAEGYNARCIVHAIKCYKISFSGYLEGVVKS